MDDPMAETTAVMMVAMMAANSVAGWVASMVEKMVAMSDHELVLRMAEYWVDSSDDRMAETMVMMMVAMMAANSVAG